MKIADFAQEFEVWDRTVRSWRRRGMPDPKANAEAAREWVRQNIGPARLGGKRPGAGRPPKADRARSRRPPKRPTRAKAAKPSQEPAAPIAAPMAPRADQPPELAELVERISARDAPPTNAVHADVLLRVTPEELARIIHLAPAVGVTPATLRALIDVQTLRERSVESGQREAKLLHRDDVAATWSRALAELSQALRRVPARAASSLLGAGPAGREIDAEHLAPIRESIAREIDAALSALVARWDTPDA